MTITKTNESDRINYTVENVSADNWQEARALAAEALAGHKLRTARESEIYGSIPTNEEETSWMIFSRYTRGGRKS